MKHTEEQIIKIAEAVMKNIGWGYDKSKQTRASFVSIEEQCEGKQGFERFEEYKKTLKAKWTAYFDFPPDSDIQFNSIFLDIDDNSGLPVKVYHKQAAFNFQKRENGDWELIKYY